MNAIWRKLLARLRVPPFEGRWTPQVLEQNTLEPELIGTDQHS